MNIVKFFTHFLFDKLHIIAFCMSSVLFFFTACEETFVPKPRGFQRIEFPLKKYVKTRTDCGFGMEIPEYAVIEKDNHPTAKPCWYNIHYGRFNATLHISYENFSSEKDLIKLTEDARTLVYKHTIKADEIYETQISNAYIKGMLYELSGSTATNFQFYVVDGKNNYLRGALYFNERTNTDSVAPVLAFLKDDIIHSLETLKWH
jgi:gliding motility-associated lipoprotein GldD